VEFYLQIIYKFMYNEMGCTMCPEKVWMVFIGEYFTKTGSDDST